MNFELSFYKIAHRWIKKFPPIFFFHKFFNFSYFNSKYWDTVCFPQGDSFINNVLMSGKCYFLLSFFLLFIVIFSFPDRAHKNIPKCFLFLKLNQNLICDGLISNKNWINELMFWWQSNHAMKNQTFISFFG